MSGGGQQQTSSTQTSIPDYAKPYVQTMLGQAGALTSEPYQAYTGERAAQFTPLQQQSFAGAQNLGPAGQLGMATSLAQQAGQAGLAAIREATAATQSSTRSQAPAAAAVVASARRTRTAGAAEAAAALAQAARAQITRQAPKEPEPADKETTAGIRWRPEEPVSVAVVAQVLREATAPQTSAVVVEQELPAASPGAASLALAVAVVVD